MSSWTVGLVAAAAVGGLAVSVIAQTPAPTSPPEVRGRVGPAEHVRRQQDGVADTLPGGRYNAINIPLRLLIMHSYRLQEPQLVGAPEWIASERFDIVAKAEGEFIPPNPADTPSRVQLMMQPLLEERFKLKVHREPSEVPIYALVRARSDGKLGPELKPSTVDCEALAAARRSGGRAARTAQTRRAAAVRRAGGVRRIHCGGQPLLELVAPRCRRTSGGASSIEPV